MRGVEVDFAALCIIVEKLRKQVEELEDRVSALECGVLPPPSTIG